MLIPQRGFTMTYGEIVRIKGFSVELSPKMLEPLGIFPNSKVSGIYLPSYESDRDLPAYRYRHDLVFTSIHYKVWPFMAKFTLTLNHSLGTLGMASAIMNDMGVNVLAAECNRAGHQFAIWNAVCEFEEIKAKHFKELIEIRSDDSDVEVVRSNLRKKLAEIKEEVTLTCRKIVESMKHLLAKTLYEHTDIRATNYHYLSSLAHYYSHQVYYRAFPARCDRTGSTIEFDTKKAKPRLDKYNNIDFPTLGFATVDLDEFTLRISVIEQKHLNRFIEIEAHYERMSPDKVISSARGLLSATMKATTKNGINLWRIYNSTSEATLRNEFGFIRLFAELPDQLLDSPVEAIKDRLTADIESNMTQTPRLSYTRLSDIGITPLRAETVFVSLKFESYRRNELIDLVKKVGREFGLPEQCIIIVEEYISPVSDKVINEVKRCDAMICIFTGISPEVDFTWIEMEYVLARAFEKRVVRLIDRAMLKMPTFEKDTPSIEFDSRKPAADIELKLREAFTAVLA